MFLSYFEGINFCQYVNKVKPVRWRLGRSPLVQFCIMALSGGINNYCLRHLAHLLCMRFGHIPLRANFAHSCVHQQIYSSLKFFYKLRSIASLSCLLKSACATCVCLCLALLHRCMCNKKRQVHK